MLSIARVLFSKNIPFCLYRFPNEQHFRLAIDIMYIDKNQNRKTFWFAPFYSVSDNEDIFLSVIDEHELSESFIQYIQDLPEQKPIEVGLPDETAKEQYFRQIEAFLSEIKSGRLDKAVLSRVLYQEKPLDFNAVDFFLTLAAAYTNTFVHLSQHPKSGIWVGATPELLVKKSSKEMYIMALAGTQARQSAGTKYTWRPKELEEHLMVNKHIEQVLEKYNYSILTKDELHTVESASVAHLRTDFVFKENQTIDLKSLLKELHPTPSVGGLPVKNGIECILKHEGYNRSYYCGFLGETDFENTANLYINLRCLQVGKNHLAIYVGGGITAASNPDEEWEETILKSKTMTEKIQPEIIKSTHGIVR